MSSSESRGSGGGIAETKIFMSYAPTETALLANYTPSWSPIGFKAVKIKINIIIRCFNTEISFSRYSVDAIFLLA